MVSIENGLGTEALKHIIVPVPILTMPLHGNVLNYLEPICPTFE